MFNRIANSWELIKASARVLQADKELMIFPIVSAIGTLIVSAVFILPMIFSNFFDAVFMGGSEVIGFVVLFVFYIVQYTVIFFANTALVAAAMIRLEGGDPTLVDGFRAAFQRIGPIFGYALISATVGMILRALSNRKNTIGRIVIGLIGLAWNLATFLVVPVLAVENIGPIDAIKRSVSLLRQTWGEQIAGNFGINLIFGLVAVAVFLLAMPIAYLAIAVLESVWMIVALVVVEVMLFIAISLVSATLNGIFTAAVYQYATTGHVSGFFEESLVANTFRSQTPKSLFGSPAGF